ncbi:MAG TPA: DUF1573 domain-containing protein [Aquaticitalea sp.]|nr:DUF1573 domain-containing protein [Aquaticitalea sp.]HNU59512.1 DUF1573 domain-containing protein [Aquaticitalea sp.]
MKKVILGFGVFCMIAFNSCKDNAESKINADNVAAAADRDANSGKLPAIEFNETVHDFGTIPNGIPVKTTFTYKNTGASPLVVSNIKSTCGCTVPTNWTKEVMPGETGQFEVEFNGKGNGNQVSKTITLTTNTEKGTETVSIKAFVEADPNAPKTTGAATVVPQQPAGAVTPVKSSTQPGHEGHNHD